MYGETGVAVFEASPLAGLSPHVRGNHRARDDVHEEFGSIPACTGKPSGRSGGSLPCWVYPRMYGETGLPSRAAPAAEGLSPHVRGNLGNTGNTGSIEGSIPACTGKPHTSDYKRIFRGVYPRMYGETLVWRMAAERGRGLSPHVRGNHLRQPYHDARFGSIPACTGKPRFHHLMQDGAEVYPRMYGETGAPTLRYCSIRGLSPHVRGNRCGSAGVSGL